MLKSAAQRYLMFAEDIKTFSWWTKVYVTIFGEKMITVDKMLEMHEAVETVCTTEFRIMRNGNIYLMSEKYEQNKIGVNYE